MQICRRDSHRCRMSPEARSPETPDGTKTICSRCCYDLMSCSCGPFLLPLPVRPEGGKPCPFQKHGFFLYWADWVRTRCWDLWSKPPPTGPHGAAGPPSAQASRGTARGCCLVTHTQASSSSFLLCDHWIFPPTFEFHQLLVVLPAQCNLFPVFLKKVFVGFRHLANGRRYLPNNGRFTSDLWILQESKSWLNVALHTCLFASLIAAP